MHAILLFFPPGCGIHSRGRHYTNNTNQRACARSHGNIHNSMQAVPVTEAMVVTAPPEVNTTTAITNTNTNTAQEDEKPISKKQLKRLKKRELYVYLCFCIRSAYTATDLYFRVFYSLSLTHKQNQTNNEAGLKKRNRKGKLSRKQRRKKLRKSEGQR